MAEADKSAGGPVPREQLRAGNDDREQVVKQLNAAFSEGRLDLAELEERVSAAYAAKTLGELRPLTADLPSPAWSAGTVPPPAWPPPAWPPTPPPRPTNRPATVNDLKQVAIDLATAKLSARLERDRIRQQRHAMRDHQRELSRQRRHDVANFASGPQGVAAWAATSTICFVIWLISVLTGSWTGPWFLWVAGPWGALLLMRHLSGRRTS